MKRSDLEVGEAYLHSDKRYHEPGDTTVRRLVVVSLDHYGWRATSRMSWGARYEGSGITVEGLDGEEVTLPPGIERTRDGSRGSYVLVTDGRAYSIAEVTSLKTKWSEVDARTLEATARASAYTEERARRAERGDSNRARVLALIGEEHDRAVSPRESGDIDLDVEALEALLAFAEGNRPTDLAVTEEGRS